MTEWKIITVYPSPILELKRISWSFLANVIAGRDKKQLLEHVRKKYDYMPPSTIGYQNLYAIDAVNVSWNEWDIDDYVEAHYTDYEWR